MANPTGYNTPNVQKPDGTWEIHGTLDIKKATGGVLKIDGTDVSAGLEELANLNGLSSTEVGFIDGAVAGTNTASKALVVDAAKHVDEINTASLKLGASGATTAVTATAAELNKVAGVTGGTTTASKALVVDANKRLDALVIADGGFALGTGAGTAVTATAAELNELDDISSFAQSTISVAAESGTDIDVTITLKDAANAAISGARRVKWWLSDSATTGAIATDDGITVTAVTNGSLLVEHTDDLIGEAMTSTAGVLTLRVAHADDSTAKYLWVDAPGFKKPKVSAVIDHAS